MCPLRQLIGEQLKRSLCTPVRTIMHVKEPEADPVIVFFCCFFFCPCVFIGWAMQIEGYQTKFWAVGSSLSFWFEQDNDVGRPEARIRPLWRTVSFGLAGSFVLRVKTASRNSLHVLLGLDHEGTRAGEPRSLAKLNKLRKKKNKTIQGTNKYCKMETQLSNEHIVLPALDTSRFFSFCLKNPKNPQTGPRGVSTS